MLAYDRPVTRDPLFWLLLVALVAVVGAVHSVGDLVLAVVVQYAVFGLVALSIRRRVRARD